YADAAQLSFLGRVIQEALRLYPPIPSLSRRARCPVELSGATVPAEASVGLSQWQIHRDERFFTQPGTFDPDRWGRDDGGGVLREDAYFPFGLGARRCIGERYALVEMKLMVATIAQRWRLRVPERAGMKLDMSAAARPER